MSAATARKPWTCSECGDEQWGGDQIPHRETGAPCCDDCYDDLYYDYCTRCADKVEKEEIECKPGHLFGIWRGEDCDIASGYYRVKRWPMLGGSMLGAGFFFEDAIEFVAPLDKDGEEAAERESHASGPMCEQCRAAIARMDPQPEK